MSGFFDATCSKCRRRYGWRGDLSDRPACPRCGHVLSEESLAADRREVEAFREFLRRKKEGK